MILLTAVDIINEAIEPNGKTGITSKTINITE